MRPNFARPLQAACLALALAAAATSAAPAPVTPDASPEARAVLAYLYEQFGKKTLSGQMYAPWARTDETELMKSTTGKYPAIRGQDLIHESANGREIQQAIAWWKAGGIPTIMWHWGAPTLGEGYEASKGTIDVSKCFVAGTPENKAMRADLERIADHLQVLRDAHVPVLWRPMHENDGGWFWYGKGGAANFRRLWQTMFDYFAKERKLDNLIWVMCHSGTPKADWNPGPGYVDLAGGDTYAGSNDPQLGIFNTVKTIYGSTMPKTLHECGILPDPDRAFAQGATWSWWMLWHTSYAENHNRDELRRIYSHDLIVTRDELPNWSTYMARGDSFSMVATAGTGGGVSRSPSSEMVAKGTNVTFAALADSGWTFIRWSGSSRATTNPLVLSATSDLSLTALFAPAPGTNVLRNGDFSGGSQGWSALATYGTAAATGAVTGGEYVATITAGGGNAWDVQLIQPGIVLERGRNYQLSFEASASVARGLFVKIGQDGDPWAAYDTMQVGLGPTPQTFTSTFTMTAATDSAARLEFNMGQETPAVRIDRVSLRIAAATTGADRSPVRRAGIEVIREPAGFRLACGALACATISLIALDGRIQRLQDGAGFVPYGRFSPGMYVVQIGVGAGAIRGMLVIDR